MKQYSKEEIERVRNKAIEDFSSLTPDEQKILEYAPNQDPREVDSDSYSALQIQNIKKDAAHGKEPTPEQKAAIIGKKQDKANQTINRVIHGTNDVFRKHYNFKEDGVSFDIAIREPNIREQGLILSRASAYLDGLGNYVDPTIYNIYYTLALIRECGVDVPIELADDETMYSPANRWLLQIWRDFSDWEARFQS